MEKRCQVSVSVAEVECLMGDGGETDQLVDEQPEEIVFLLRLLAEEVEDEGQRLGADVRECIERERL